MIQYEYLQMYWWFLIALLGAILVFMLFVQGGQTMLWKAKTDIVRSMMINSLGRKWELGFTSLVVFGGALFASFPLYYSTSFGGAYWLWIVILFSFIIQAVSYEFRRKSGNVWGTKTYDIFLSINGTMGTILLGVAVGMFFFGGSFTVEKQNILDVNSPVISRWIYTHGIESMFNWKNLLLGVTILFLARSQAALYFINNIQDEDIRKKMGNELLFNGFIFVALFITFLIILFISNGYQFISKSGIPTIPNSFESVKYKYFINAIDLWWFSLILVIGVGCVLYSFVRTIVCRNFIKGIWFSGIGTIMVVLSLLCIAGYNYTPYFPSNTNSSSSLTIYNSSSSEYTLTVMSIVSLIIPFVIGYIAYVWYSMDKKKITRNEMENTKIKY